MITRSFSVNRELWERVRAEAKNRGFSVSAIIRALLRMWVNGEVEIQL